jgi:hypothetical protein
MGNESKIKVVEMKINIKEILKNEWSRHTKKDKIMTFVTLAVLISFIIFYLWTLNWQIPAYRYGIFKGWGTFP